MYRYYKHSRSRGHRSRLQLDIITAKICHIINNSVADCSILLKIVADSDHVIPDVLQMFKVVSKVKVPA